MKKHLNLFALLFAGLFFVSLANAQAATPVSPPANVGQKVTFTVTVQSGTQPFNYQWQKTPANAPSGTQPANIAGATAGIFVIPNVQLTDAGTYSVVVSNGAGSTTASDTLVVQLVPPGGATASHTAN